MPERQLIRNEPTVLETSIRSVRKSVFQVYNTTRSTLGDLVDKWIGIEKDVENTLKEVAPKGEETILPGAIYVGIAGMAGSILARNRTTHFVPCGSDGQECFRFDSSPR